MAPRTFANPSPHRIPAKLNTRRRLTLRSVALAAVLAAPTWAAEFTEECRLYGAVEKPCDPRQKGDTLWPNGDVYYQFAKSPNPNPLARKPDQADPANNERVLTAREKELIRQGMAFWNEMTSGLVDFKESTTHPDRVIILGRTDGCCSVPLGRQTNRRANIGTENQLTIQHELGHILGLDHHHKRPDRDRFVRVDQDLFCKGNPHPDIKVNIDPKADSMQTMDSLQDGCNLAQDWRSLDHASEVANAAGSDSCQAYNGQIEYWVRGNVNTCSDTDYGPYNVNSVMQYGTDPAYCVGTRCTMDGRTGVDVAVTHVNVDVGARSTKSTSRIPTVPRSWRCMRKTRAGIGFGPFRGATQERPRRST